MISSSTKIFLLLLVLSSLLSCSGQMKPETKQIEPKTTEIGKVVSELDNQIWSIFQDNNGTIWLGTNNDGVYKQNGEKFEKVEPKQ